MGKFITASSGYVGIGGVTFWLKPKDQFSVAGLLGFGWHVLIKAPWNVALFSERYGLEKFAQLGFGWRVKVSRTADDWRK